MDRASLHRLPCVLAFVLVFCLGCSQPRAGDEDGGSTAFDAARDGDPEDDGDDQLDPQPGPWSVVMHRMELVTERVCDLDGDGFGDNYLADMGAGSGQMVAALINGLIRDSVDGGGVLFLLHCPWCDDVANMSDQDFLVLNFEGRDVDYPRDDSDDFAGDEEFFVSGASLDPCGEPNYVGQGSLLSGELHIEPHRILFPWGEMPIGLRDARVDGVMEPHAAAVELFACGHTTFHDLGQRDGPTGFGDLNQLETVSAAGVMYGAAGTDGLRADLDLDGDGLEAVAFDDVGRVAYCTDGNGDVLEGRTCWQHPNMADGISLSVFMAGVSGNVVGREPGWESYGADRGLTCDEGPPDASLFDPPP